MSKEVSPEAQAANEDLMMERIRRVIALTDAGVPTKFAMQIVFADKLLAKKMQQAAA